MNVQKFSTLKVNVSHRWQLLSYCLASARPQTNLNPVSTNLHGNSSRWMCFQCLFLLELRGMLVFTSTSLCLAHFLLASVCLLVCLSSCQPVCLSGYTPPPPPPFISLCVSLCLSVSLSLSLSLSLFLSLNKPSVVCQVHDEFVLPQLPPDWRL